MEIEAVRKFFAWCTVINWAFLLFWWVAVTLAGDWVYRMHGKWFKISRETFEATHYAGMAFCKVIIFIFNMVPYLVLRLFF